MTSLELVSWFVDYVTFKWLGNVFNLRTFSLCLVNIFSVCASKWTLIFLLESSFAWKWRCWCLQSSWGISFVSPAAQTDRFSWRWCRWKNAENFPYCSFRYCRHVCRFCQSVSSLLCHRLRLHFAVGRDLVKKKKYDAFEASSFAARCRTAWRQFVARKKKKYKSRTLEEAWIQLLLSGKLHLFGL